MSRTFDHFRRAGACSRRNFIRTAEDVCPYSENCSVLPYTFDFLKKPPLLCKGGGFERQRKDGGIVWWETTVYSYREDKKLAQTP